MKFSFTLEKDQRLILSILKEAGRIHYPILERILDTIKSSESGFSTFVKFAASKNNDKYDYTPDWQKPKLSKLERTIEGLIFVGLVRRILHEGSKSYTYLEDVLTEDDLELTDEGERVAQSIKDKRRLILRPTPPRRTTIFVACAFGRDDVDELFNSQIHPACTALGYEACRIDMSEPSQTITESIIEGITECACTIADLTYARPSVYFEVGFAHGLGVPLLLMCRSDHDRGSSENLKVHFDLEQFKISFWSHTENGKFHWPRKMKPIDRLRKLVPIISSDKRIKSAKKG